MGAGCRAPCAVGKRTTPPSPAKLTYLNVCLRTYLLTHSLTYLLTYSLTFKPRKCAESLLQMSRAVRRSLRARGHVPPMSDMTDYVGLSWVMLETPPIVRDG